jgi:enoyl-CoA hydratase
MSQLVTTTTAESIATIVMDDGKANVMSVAMQSALHEALDSAQSANAVVVLTSGRKMFSGGFDLSVIAGADQAMADMLTGGFELSARLLAFPTPVVMASPGHCVAMGAFLFLSGDYLIGANGPFKYVTNEVAIGMTMPRAPLEVMRNRLTPAALTRAALLAEVFTPETAVAAGFVDQIVEPDELASAAQSAAARFATLNMTAHRLSKLRARGPMLKALHEGIAGDAAEIAELMAAVASKA